MFGIKSGFQKKILNKRDQEIISRVKKLFADEKTALDVGCGNGRLTKKLQDCFGLQVKGLEIRHPKNPFIEVMLFDGKKLPFPDNSFDTVFFIDVLHHTTNQKSLLEEALRVAKKSVIIKDHFYETNFNFFILKLADFTGNPSGTPLPFTFNSKKEWAELIQPREFKSIEWASKPFPGLKINEIIFRIESENRL